MESIRVAIVEGSPAVRRAIESILAADPGVEILTEPASLTELAASRHAPDVLVADFRACCCAPGRAALHALRRRCPGLRLIITSSDDEREYAAAAGGLRADELVPKRHLAEDLPRALRRTTP